MGGGSRQRAVTKKKEAPRFLTQLLVLCFLPPFTGWFGVSVAWWAP